MQQRCMPMLERIALAVVVLSASAASASAADPAAGERSWRRSEEHTSELQSLMRISYAVFCLKKKNLLSRSRSTTKKHKSKHSEMHSHKEMIRIAHHQQY